MTVAEEASKIDAALAERFCERPAQYNPGTDALPIDMPSGETFFFLRLTLTGCFNFVDLLLGVN